MNLSEARLESGDGVLADVTGRTMRLARGILAQQSRDQAFGPDDALVDVGLSSLDLVNLMIAVEVEFDTMIPPTQLNPKNFQSIFSIARMIVSLTSPADREHMAFASQAPETRRQ